MNIEQISYIEGVFQFDNNVYEAGKALSVTMTPVMKIGAGDDNIPSLQLTVKYMLDEICSRLWDYEITDYCF